MNDATGDKCPRCHDARLRAWDELTDDEREVVRRLPAADGDVPPAERTARRRWCTRCWHEDDGRAPRHA